MISFDNVNKGKLYWILQFFGWCSFFVIFSLITASFAGFQWQVFAGHLNTVVVGFLLTHFYRSYIKRNEWVRLGIFRLALSVLAACFIIASIWALIVLPINRIFFPVENDQELTPLIVVIVVLNLSIITLGWSLIYFLFQVFINFKKSEVEKWKLEAAVKDAELIALKSQVNPHFIFNSLNNIRSLVIENPEKARDMITHLSGLLRYSIQFNNMERVSLEHELEIVQNYLNLESIQFEDRLQYKLEIKPETLDLKIPPMAIQLLVENAIKHGISNLPEGGQINIRSYLENNILNVEVINTGQLVKCNDSTGIGLQNASNRLKLLFGKLSDLKIQNLDSNFVSAKFTIPLNE
ncbi:hypothetical protein C900_00921 [Fulvivirga imtechensis AK7]|uniref:Signal transduction histidine kinase internal region domain-containing protein n=1 Tax=Fulvivirga imtechensis AK7 TaxID=1237149 RepID=L8JVY1_9BACT|nr:histidine kinase [Fulvivirga imtechensis]ELR72960.1 hypothetical protein C900_00921 [Fulvivirga imtechensis AK7]